MKLLLAEKSTIHGSRCHSLDVIYTQLCNNIIFDSYKSGVQSANVMSNLWGLPESSYKYTRSSDDPLPKLI